MLRYGLRYAESCIYRPCSPHTATDKDLWSVYYPRFDEQMMSCIAFFVFRKSTSSKRTRLGRLMNVLYYVVLFISKCYSMLWSLSANPSTISGGWSFINNMYFDAHPDGYVSREGLEIAGVWLFFQHDISMRGQAQGRRILAMAGNGHVGDILDIWNRAYFFGGWKKSCTSW